MSPADLGRTGTRLAKTHRHLSALASAQTHRPTRRLTATLTPGPWPKANPPGPTPAPRAWIERLLHRPPYDAKPPNVPVRGVPAPRPPGSPSASGPPAGHWAQQAPPRMQNRAPGLQARLTRQGRAATALGPPTGQPAPTDGQPGPEGRGQRAARSHRLLFAPGGP